VFGIVLVTILWLLGQGYALAAAAEVVIATAGRHSGRCSARRTGTRLRARLL